MGSKTWRKLNANITDLPPIFTASYFPSLDGLRAISILMVIVFHVALSYKSPFNFHPYANLGVQFFFVISGFLITTLLLKERLSKGTISLKKFYIRRFFRIIPVAWLYVLSVALGAFLFDVELAILPLIAALFFFRNFTMNYSGANHLTSHYWSLSVEEQFYLIFPFLIKANLNRYTYFLILIICCSIVFDFYKPGIHAWPIDIAIRAIEQFCSIAIGSLTSILVFKNIISFSGNVRYKTPIILSLIALIIFSTSVRAYLPGVATALSSIFFSGILLLNLTKSNDIIFRFLNHKATKFIGVLSYSIYIWQQPFTLNINFLNDRYPSIPSWTVTAISLTVLAFVSYISYFYYEKAFLKYKERFK